MNGVVESCFVMFFVIVVFFVNLLHLVWKILVCSVHGLVSLILMAEHVQVWQYFGPSYAMRTSVQAYSAWKLLKVAVRLWGGGLVSCKVIKDLVLYCVALCCSGFALNDTFGLCTPLCPLENLYK